jgi:hypothetical protein
LLPHLSLYCFTLVLHTYSIIFHLPFLPFNLLPHLSNCYLALSPIVSCLCCFVFHFTSCCLTFHPITSYVTLLLHIFKNTFYCSIPFVVKLLVILRFVSYFSHMLSDEILKVHHTRILSCFGPGMGV